MSIRFEDAGEPAEADDLEALEGRAGRPLPAGYRDFLEHHDGAVPEANELPDAAAAHGVKVARLFSVAEVMAQLDALGPDRVPEEVLPIADDEEGYGVFVHLEDGSIWSWDPEAEDPEEADLWAAFTREADDLEELLDRLEPSEELDEDREPLDEGYVDAEFLRDEGGRGEVED